MGAHRSIGCIAIVAMAACPASLLPADEAVFMGLGDLPGGHTFSIAHSVSADGAVVAGVSGSNSGGAGGYEAFRWTASEGIVGLGDLYGPGNVSSCANGVCSHGPLIVGWSRSAATNPRDEAFLWGLEDGMVGLGSLPGGQVGSNAADVSADGSVVVGHAHFASGAAAAFRWTANEGMVALEDLPGGPLGSLAHGVSADGSVIVGRSASEAFRWTPSEGLVGLGDLPGGMFDSTALGVSADGSTVVGSGETAFGNKAFRWTEETGMVPLGDLDGDAGFQSVAWAVSADGSVVVGGGTSTGPPTCGAFIWDSVNGIRPIRDWLQADFGVDLSGWELCLATDVSANGRCIVGYGRNPNGTTEAWIARVLEPVLLLLMDVKPGACPNSVAPHSHGVLPVALVGTHEFDVTEIDVASIMLSRADGLGGSVAPNEGPPGPHSVFADIATPFAGGPCDCHDLEGDGIMDLSMKFKIDCVVDALGLAETHGNVELIITGLLLDGTSFEARDCVALVPQQGNPVGRGKHGGLSAP